MVGTRSLQALVEEQITGRGTKRIANATLGVGDAVANAVYHATSRRTRSLPITIEQLL